jgi:hypothetical protein
MLRWLPSFR